MKKQENGIHGINRSQRDMLYESENDRTFQNDDLLPSLPVPQLQLTLERYLDTVRPVVDDQEYAQTEDICKHFAEGIGKTLQDKLIERGNKYKNWVRGVIA